MRTLMSLGSRVTVLAAAVVLAACGTAPPSPAVTAAPPITNAPASTGTATSPSAAATPEVTWAADLDRLDSWVRANHVSPFTIHPETDWTARLAEVRAGVETAANDDERVVLLASLVSLLDSHTWYWRESGFMPYPVALYHFTEGWFVTAAVDPELVGAKLVSINGHPAAEVEATFRRLVPYDNESGFLLNGAIELAYSELLHGAGIVSDVARPQFTLTLPGGKNVTRDFAPITQSAYEEGLGLIHTLVGKAPEAVARNGEVIWFRIEKGKVFHIAVNDYGDETAVIAALEATFDSGKADRVVLDIRFLPGGNGDFALLDAIRNDPRINQPGGLTVLIGRENYSVATAIIRVLDVDTDALLIGEPTPARADNFRCDCHELVLPAFDISVQVPTQWDRLGDDRPEIAPDVTTLLSAADFFAGRDPVLDAALTGITGH